MSVTHIVGIDPGLVHTGVVRLVFYPGVRSFMVEHEAIAGPDVEAAWQWIGQPYLLPMAEVFVEGYRPRSAFNTDSRMTDAVNRFRREITGAKVLDNTGVKKIVTRELMEVFDVWKFSTVTNHQDLRSAARIALLGMLKDEQHNQLLSDVLRDKLAGKPWAVRAEL